MTVAIHIPLALEIQGGVGFNAQLSIAIPLDFAIEAASYSPGSMQFPIVLGSSPQAVDFDNAPSSPGAPAPQSGSPTAPGVWHLWTSTSVSTATFTHTGPNIVIEVWMSAEGSIGAMDADDMTLMAHSTSGSIEFDAGQDVTYLIRTHAITDGTTAAGSLSWSTVARSTVGTLVVEAPEHAVGQEGWLEVRILNASEGASLTAHVDTVLSTSAMSADESGVVTSMSVLLDGVATGTHTLRVTDAVTGEYAEVSFEVFAQLITSTPVVPPVVTLPTPSGAAVPRWKFYVPGEPVVELLHNPSTMSSPHSQRIYSLDHTTDPAGQQIIFEGQAAPVDWTVEGTVLSQGDYGIWESRLASNARFYVIDHLERAWVVTLESVDWGEKRNTSNDWTIGYRAKFNIYAGPFPLETP